MLIQFPCHQGPVPGLRGVVVVMVRNRLKQKPESGYAIMLNATQTLDCNDAQFHHFEGS